VCLEPLLKVAAGGHDNVAVDRPFATTEQKPALKDTNGPAKRRVVGEIKDAHNRSGARTTRDDADGPQLTIVCHGRYGVALTLW